MAVVALCGTSYATTSVAVAEQDYKTIWQQPISLDLPEPVRSLHLPAGKDVQMFVQTAGIEQFRSFALGEGTLIEAPMESAQWQQVRSKHCAPALGGAACEDSACRAVQSTSGARLGADPDAPVVKAHLTQDSERSLLTALSDPAPETSCRAPLAGLESTSNPRSGPGRNLNFQLDLREPKRNRALTTKPIDANSVGLSDNSLPANSSQWSLTATADCRSVQVPLDSVSPARLPGVVTTLLRNDNGAQVASRHGLKLLTERALTATGERLAVMATGDKFLSVVAALLADPDVVSAQEEFVYRTAGTRAPQDPLAALTYAPSKLGVMSLPNPVRGAGQQVVIIDTGADAQHPDLAGRLSATFDTTGSGFTADAHGTAVAGVIAAGANNNIGGYGIAPDVELVVIKACTPSTQGGMGARCVTSDLVAALDLALGQKARLINLSLTGPPDPLVERYIKLAQEQGALVIAAAGNGGAAARPAFPAALPGVLAVTALDATDRLYASANHGTYIDVAAPGVDLITTAPGNRYPSVSGTSFAAAAVSGVAALLRELRPGIPATELRQTLINSGSDLGRNGRDELFGGGLVNACVAAGTPCPGSVQQ